MATLIHHKPHTRPPAQFALLYVHGWSDYFYNVEMAEFFTSVGGEFYAVDMHAVGRSLRPHQIAGYVGSLREYFADLDAAASFIHASHPDLPLVLLAHSQGALTAGLWIKENEGGNGSAQQHAGASALILNGPWLDLPFTPLLRRVLNPVAQIWGQLRPKARIPIASPRLYERTISTEFGGEWPINEQWRVDPRSPAHPAWARTILEAQGIFARGLDLKVPILALTAHRSLIRPRWSEEMWQADVITDVKQTWRMLPRLGSDITLIKVRDAVHDVLLSAAPIRRKAYEYLKDWLADQPGFPAEQTGHSADLPCTVMAQRCRNGLSGGASSASGEAAAQLTTDAIGY